MPAKNIDNNDLKRGERFEKVCENLFPRSSNREIGDKLGGYPEATIRYWKKGGAIGNTAIYHLDKLGVSFGYLLNGEGEMLRKESQKKASTQRVEAKNYDTESLTELVGISNVISLALQKLIVGKAEGKIHTADLLKLFDDVASSIEKSQANQSMETPLKLSS